MAVSETEIPLADSVKQFISSSKKLFINGEWVDAVSGKTFPTYNPATEEVLSEVAEGDAADIDLAVQAARSAFEHPTWRDLSPSKRGQLIWKLADLIEAHSDEFAQIEALDNGKSVFIAKIADVPLSVDILRYMAGWTTKIEGKTQTISNGINPQAKYFSYSVREPVGVVGQIIPWNFPLLMAILKIAPALATGCTIVLKPAEQTPLSALLLGQLIAEAGIPAGVVNIVPGYGETAGAALAAHPGVDKIAFTGSTEVGRLIAKAAAGNLKKVSLELGGKSPNVIFKDADLSKAIPGAAFAAYSNHGQNCLAGSRLFVQEEIFEQVVGAIAGFSQQIKLGSGFDLTAQMGPLVSQEQLERVTGYISSGLSQGAQAISGGKRSGERGYFVEPTVLVNVKHDMKVVQEEIFGPVVVAMPFKDEEDLYAVANDTIYGLGSGVWTTDLARAHRTAAFLRAGTVWVNCYNVFDPALPLGGYKASGWGRELGEEVLDLYLETKTVCMEL